MIRLFMVVLLGSAALDASLALLFLSGRLMVASLRKIVIEFCPPIMGLKAVAYSKAPAQFCAQW
jgi:hypothetical protein